MVQKLLTVGKISFRLWIVLFALFTFGLGLHEHRPSELPIVLSIVWHIVIIGVVAWPVSVFAVWLPLLVKKGRLERYDGIRDKSIEG